MDSMIKSQSRVLSFSIGFEVVFFKMNHWEMTGVPGRARTCDLRIRNPLLYPTELRAQTVMITL